MSLMPKGKAERARAELAAGDEHPVVEQARNALDQAFRNVEVATTPSERDDARSVAEGVADMLMRTLKMSRGSAPDLVTLCRSAQVLAVDAAVKLGDDVVANNATEDRETVAAGLVHRDPGEAKEEIKALLQVSRKFADVNKVDRNRLKRSAQLALSQMIAPEEFARLRDEAIAADKPVPLNKLRALCKPAPQEREEAQDPQIAFRLPLADARALDLARGEKVTRTDWVRQLVIDAVGYEPHVCAAHLIDHAIRALERAGTTHAKVIDRLAAHVESLERAP